MQKKRNIEDFIKLNIVKDKLRKKIKNNIKEIHEINDEKKV